MIAQMYMIIIIFALVSRRKDPTIQGYIVRNVDLDGYCGVICETILKELIGFLGRNGAFKVPNRLLVSLLPEISKNKSDWSAHEFTWVWERLCIDEKCWYFSTVFLAGTLTVRFLYRVQDVKRKLFFLRETTKPENALSTFAWEHVVSKCYDSEAHEAIQSFFLVV